MQASKAKVGIITNSSWNVFNFRMGLIEMILEAGYEVVVIAPDQEYEAFFKEKGLIFHRVKHLARKGTNPIRDLFYLIELLRVFKKYKIAMALLYTVKPNIYGTFAGAFLGIPTIATLTGLGHSFLSGRITRFFVTILYRLASKFSAKIIFHNEDDRAMFVENGWVAEKKSAVIHGSGVDKRKFAPQKSDSKSDHFSFLYFGRLLYDKGIRELLEAFRLLKNEQKNTRLILLGDIDDKNPSAFNKSELKKYLEAEKNIEYHPGTKDVRPFIAAADAVVLPSYREGLPKTILEAMSMAKPIIVSDVPGCRDTISNNQPGNGYFCKVKDAESLFRAMKKMALLSVEERTRMGKISREMVEKKFERSKINQAYLKLIDEHIRTKVPVEHEKKR